eukprot:6156863-Amphidinium_carterae.1
MEPSPNKMIVIGHVTIVVLIWASSPTVPGPPSNLCGEKNAASTAASGHTMLSEQTFYAEPFKRSKCDNMAQVFLRLFKSAGKEKTSVCAPVMHRVDTSSFDGIPIG